MTTPREKLFQKGKIGNLEIKNRIVMTSVLASVAENDGSVSDKLIAWYEERARGGAGLIITGACAVHAETGPPATRGMLLNARRHIAPLERLSSSLHKYDAKLFVQLYHRGAEASPEQMGGKVPVSASEFKTRFGQTAHSLSKDEIKDITRSFINGAKLAKEAGVDGVEIHAAHGYLINQFLSPYFNRRADEYGGDLEGRMLFLLEILAGIKEAVGENFPVGVRFSADEFVNGGNGLDDGIEIAKLLEKNGAHYLNISCGIQETSYLNREPPSYEQGWKKHLAQSIKPAVKIPVIAVSTVKTPEFAESLLTENVCDFVGVTRGQMADPQWAIKAKLGKDDEIQTCISCLTCFEEHSKGHVMKCAVNPTLQRELEFKDWNKNGNRRNVLVIGGGPAGMTAAWVLRKRGFAVTLYEKSESLGGQLNLAEKPPHKQKITWLKEHMSARMIKSGIDLHLGERIGVADIKALDPAGIFICCGSKPIVPSKITGIGGANVFTIPEVLSGNANINGRRVLIAGSGLSGLETALYLGERGYDLSIIEMQPEIGPDVFKPVRDDILNGLSDIGASFFPGCRLEEIAGESIKLVNLSGEEIRLEADAVILSLGVRPNVEELEEIINAFPDAIICGDAKKSGRLSNATADAFGRAFVFEPESEEL